MASPEEKTDLNDKISEISMSDVSELSHNNSLEMETEMID